MNEEPSTDEVRQALVNLKEQLNEVTRSLAFWCRIAVERGEVKGAASHLITSTEYVETLAEWHETFGRLDESGIEPEMKIRVDIDLLRAILDTSEPKRWREIAAHEQLSGAQVKKRARSKKKYKTHKNLISTLSKLVRADNGIWIFEVPLNEEPPEGMPPGDVILVMKER